MPIDWFTVGAQLLNFTILVWLLKRFLYQPVLDAIAAREQKIAATLADAAEAKADAHRQRDSFERKNQAFEEQRAALLREATDAAKAEGERLQGESRAQADAAGARRSQELLDDAQHLHVEIARHTQQQVFEVARRVLGDLAGQGLEQRICEVFLQHLQALEGGALATLADALQGVSDTDPARVRSAFALPEAQQSALRAALEALAGQPVPLELEVACGLVGGIELSARGQKLAWSIPDYLGALATGLDDRLRGAAGA